MYRSTQESYEAVDGRLVVAVFERDPAARESIDHHVAALGHRVAHYDSAESLLRQGEGASLACVGLAERDESGLELLGHLRARHPRLPVVVVSARRSVEWAVEAMRNGASDCIFKPLDPSLFVASMVRLLADPRPRSSPPPRPRAVAAIPASPLVGKSQAMLELHKHLERVTASDVVVCLRGETGTGKEMVTRAIHDRGSRRSGPFVAVNCAAIPHQLQESELFGHERGAFTGAIAAHRGRFEQANNGTLFLDELGEMSPATQSVLLRVLEERKVQRLGSTSEIPVNIRIICATHRDLEAEVAAGRFRQDLYFRLAVYRIDLPPLRARLEDLPALVEHFLERAALPDQPPLRISSAALSVLRAYAWPGNVRELQNVIYRAALACDGQEIGPDHLPAPIIFALAAEGLSAQAAEREETLLPFKEIERRAILRAMRVAGGSVDKAAKVLGLSRATVYRRLVDFAAATAEGKP